MCHAPAPSSWAHAPADLVLSDVEVHVWRACLDSPAMNLGGLTRILAPDERKRSECLLRLHDRVHFVVGRGLLRRILARYLQVEAADLRFEYDDYGKPRLALQWESVGLRFNVSHAGGLVLFAVTRWREVGVDVERVRQDPRMCKMLANSCALQETAVRQSITAEERRVALFTCWSRREAYLKARGSGLSIHLGLCGLVCPAGQPPALPGSGNAPEAARWRLIDLDVEPGYVAALAVEGYVWRHRMFLFQATTSGAEC